MNSVVFIVLPISLPVSSICRLNDVAVRVACDVINCDVIDDVDSSSHSRALGVRMRCLIDPLPADRAGVYWSCR